MDNTQILGSGYTMYDANTNNESFTPGVYSLNVFRASIAYTDSRACSKVFQDRIRSKISYLEAWAGRPVTPLEACGNIVAFDGSGVNNNLRALPICMTANYGEYASRNPGFYAVCKHYLPGTNQFYKAQVYSNPSDGSLSIRVELVNQSSVSHLYYCQ